MSSAFIVGAISSLEIYFFCDVPWRRIGATLYDDARRRVTLLLIFYIQY